MPKHVCGADLGAKMRWLGACVRSRTIRHVAAGMRCKATAIKTRRGAWRTGPKTEEGKARISAAARARWAAYRAAKVAASIAINAETMAVVTGEKQAGPPLAKEGG